MFSTSSVACKQEFIQRFLIHACHQYDKSAFHRAKMSHPEPYQFKPAAVMIAIVERDDDLYLLLTRRASTLKHHANQICFPGGRVETSDIDLVETAFREMKEEIGITAKRQDLLGQLTPLNTVSGYQVTPIIGFVDANYEAKLNPDEVSELFELPLSFLLQPNSIKTQHFQAMNGKYAVYAMTYQHNFIWGATAHILYALHKHIGSQNDICNASR